MNILLGGDRLISVERSRGVKVWDVHARTQIGGPYTIPGRARALALSTTGASFVVAYERGMRFVEVRECRSGYVLHGPFKVHGYQSGDDDIKLSVNKAKIICIRPFSIKVLDVVEGEIKLINLLINNVYRSDLRRPSLTTLKGLLAILRHVR